MNLTLDLALLTENPEYEKDNRGHMFYKKSLQVLLKHHQQDYQYLQRCL